MQVTRGRVLRIYPTKKQIEKIEQNFGAKRFVYNHFLDLYLKSGKRVNLFSALKELTALKKSLNYDWLVTADSVALQESIKDLQNAIKRYENKVSGKPNRKVKAGNQSYRTNNNNNNIRFKDGMLKLPKIGFVDFAGYDTLSGKIISATIKREDDKYYCSLCMREEIEVTNSKNGKCKIGVIDLPQYVEDVIEEYYIGACDAGRYNRVVDDYLQKFSTQIVRDNSDVEIAEYENQILPESQYNKLQRMIKYKKEIYN